MPKISRSKAQPTKLRLPNPPKGIIDIEEIYDKYYARNSRSRKILETHSRMVAKMALKIVDRHPWWGVDRAFVYEAAMLHDIGIFACKAYSMGCKGDEPYIRHGVIGAEILRKEGLPKHALVCERHTGVGITLESIERRKLPLPPREMVPILLEEQIICFADCFYSKSGNLKAEKTPQRIRRGLKKHGKEQVEKFDAWCKLFL